MANEDLLTQNYIKSIYSEVLTKIKEINSFLKHQVVKGSTNEKIVKKLLLSYLPKKYDIISNKLLIDHKGTRSKEEDLIIFDPMNQSGFLKPEHGIFSIDLAHAIIEVKTTLLV